MARIMAALTGVLAVAVAVFVSVTAYWMLAPYRVLRPTPQERRRVLTPVVRPGDLLLYAPMEPEGFCKQLDIPGALSRAFVNGIVYETPVATDLLRVGECRDVSKPTAIRVPSTLPPGHVYHLEGEATFQVNPIRRVTYRFITDDFEVRE